MISDVNFIEKLKETLTKVQSAVDGSPEVLGDLYSQVMGHSTEGRAIALMGAGERKYLIERYLNELHVDPTTLSALICIMQTVGSQSTSAR